MSTPGRPAPCAPVHPLARPHAHLPAFLCACTGMHAHTYPRARAHTRPTCLPARTHRRMHQRISQLKCWSQFYTKYGRRNRSLHSLVDLLLEGTAAQSAGTDSSHRYKCMCACLHIGMRGTHACILAGRHICMYERSLRRCAFMQR